MKVITSIDDAVAAVGEELGVSEWQEIDQERINAFADATGDHQWIHIDAEGAKNESPYGTTIAHGFLTLSMIPALTKDNYRVENAKMAINYGSNKVRFIAAVPSGGRIRARSELIDATKVDDNTVNMTVKNTIELDGSNKPAAVAGDDRAGAVHRPCQSLPQVRPATGIKDVLERLGFISLVERLCQIDGYSHG